MSLKRRTKIILIIVVIFVAFVVISPFFMEREKVDLTSGIIQLEEG